MSSFKLKWQEKIEVIISESSILAKAIEVNLPPTDQVRVFHLNIHNQETINNFPKVDTLILDAYLNSNIQLYNIKSVINLTDVQTTLTDVFLKKPIKLTELLQIMKVSRQKKQLFCKLNHNWIYDEQMCKLFTKNTIIRLTEKENEVFKHLLLSEGYKLVKEQLFQNIWQYHPDTNSTTFETHMSRLKRKLPVNLLQVKNNHYELNIKDIA